MKALNTLFILSDEHSRETSGCYGHPMVETPNIDALAANGTVFDSAYTPSPICIPARAALHTGKNTHETRNWCNGNPYKGETKSWAHHLSENGHDAVSIGKLHFRSTDDDNGFTEEIIPLHVVEGIGDLVGCLRTARPAKKGLEQMSEMIGPGDSSYQDYDIAIADTACDWLTKKAKENNGKPWTLFVSFVCPHFPLIAQEEFYKRYDPDKVPLPKGFANPNSLQHSALKKMKSYLDYDQHFDEEKTRIAIASYYALITFIDHQIGRILETIEQVGFTDSTRIIYSSDHGDNLGARGLWGKSTHYEESAGIPLILNGPDIPQGKRVSTPASLIDLAPTLIDFNGVVLSDSERSELSGTNLIEIAQGENSDRSILSEYHAIGSVTGTFMIRYKNWKYVHYVDYPCQLFDLEKDPNEMDDLGESDEFESIRRMCYYKLLEHCDPKEANEQAFSDQADRVRENGGQEAILKRKSIPFTPAPV